MMTPEERRQDSQRLLRKVGCEAMGVYIAKEPSEGDGWRDKPLWNNIAHLAHELEEIRNSGDLTRQYHNALDAVGQAKIIAAQILVMIEEAKKK